MLTKAAITKFCLVIGELISDTAFSLGRSDQRLPAILHCTTSEGWWWNAMLAINCTKGDIFRIGGRRTNQIVILARQDRIHGRISRVLLGRGSDVKTTRKTSKKWMRLQHTDKPTDQRTDRPTQWGIESLRWMAQVISKPLFHKPKKSYKIGR